MKKTIKTFIKRTLIFFGSVIIVFFLYFIWVIFQFFIPNKQFIAKIDIGNYETIKIVFVNANSTVADFVLFTKKNKLTQKKYRLGTYKSE